MKNLDIDTSILNNKRESLRFSNLNNSNFKAKLIENEDEEETEIKTDVNNSNLFNKEENKDNNINNISHNKINSELKKENEK